MSPSTCPTAATHSSYLTAHTSAAIRKKYKQTQHAAAAPACRLQSYHQIAVFKMISLCSNTLLVNVMDCMICGLRRCGDGLSRDFTTRWHRTPYLQPRDTRTPDPAVSNSSAASNTTAPSSRGHEASMECCPHVAWTFISHAAGLVQPAAAASRCMKAQVTASRVL